VEIQFYLIVPFLFFIFEHLEIFNPRLKFILIGLITFISFILQATASREEGHAIFQNRLWQFMSGFLAFYLNQGGYLDSWGADEKDKGGNSSDLKRSNPF
jgi:peptidoglycan/LPS O-acetylase OafA/YrhL